MLMDKTVHEFLENVKSDSPAPGGGSVAALAGALGAALAIMVGNLTVSSEKYAASHEEARQLLGQLEEKLSSLQGYVDEDTKAFYEVMKAYKLPKSTPEEKELRSQIIQQSLQFASELPMKVATICMEVLAMSKDMLEIGNVNAASDAAVAGRMAHAAMWSAIYNVKINLSSIKNEEFVTQMNEKVASVVKSSEEVFIQLVEQGNEKIG